jgi:hypothetical protein
LGEEFICLRLGGVDGELGGVSGSTTVVWMLYGSTSWRSDSIQPSSANLEAAEAAVNSLPTNPAVEMSGRRPVASTW